MRVIVIDHFDSFTNNMVDLLRILGARVFMIRSNASLKQVEKLRPTHIVLSAGEGHPKKVLLFQEMLNRYKAFLPILGICLGEQAIGMGFGAVIARGKRIMHGKSSVIYHNGEGIFSGIKDRFVAQRYHSLVVARGSLASKTLRQTARTSDGTIMGIESVKYPHVVGVQFHPESYFTEYGSEIFANFLKLRVTTRSDTK